jgi:dipeptidyl aminopeptidase/acylaminoacyl peptidase
MTSPPSLACRFPFRHSLPVFCYSLCVTLCSLWLCGQFAFLVSPVAAQDLDKPLQNIDEEITAFAFAPDGRIVYAVHRNFKTKLYDLEHDDIWLQDASGRRRRLLEGQKFNRGNKPFSYIVNSFRWSPNGRMILAELLTTTVVDDSGKTQDSFQTLVLDDGGREIRIAKGDSVIPDAANPFWLPDNVSINSLSEAVPPRMLFSLKSTRLDSGSFKSPQEGRTFRDVNPLPGTTSAIAIEQDHSQTGPSRLQRLDLLSDDDKELATLDGYEGGLSVSPSGKKVAYFLDKEILEVRDLASADRLARLRIGLGVFRWSPDESRILLKRSIEKKSGDLVWIDLPPLTTASKEHDIPISQPQPTPILHGLAFRDFAISPDGRFLAVVAPGKRNLLVFPLPQR